nr:hypothetical protein EC90111_A0048 [Escherichia coli 9.0111]
MFSYLFRKRREVTKFILLLSGVGQRATRGVSYFLLRRPVGYSLTGRYSVALTPISYAENGSSAVRYLWQAMASSESPVASANR